MGDSVHRPKSRCMLQRVSSTGWSMAGAQAQVVWHKMSGHPAGLMPQEAVMSVPDLAGHFWDSGDAMRKTADQQRRDQWRGKWVLENRLGRQQYACLLSQQAQCWSLYT